MTSLMITEADIFVNDVVVCLLLHASATLLVANESSLDPYVIPLLLSVNVPVLDPLVMETELMVAVAPERTNEAGVNAPTIFSEKVA